MHPSTLPFHQASFAISAANVTQCPNDSVREVAFAGRSNAGKSSALNALTHQKKLARTSKTPGRTQLINFFRLGGEPLYLVDLPGYGYAKVPLKMKNEWQKSLGVYLQERKPLSGLVLLMDIRHPLTDFDTAMLDWAQSANTRVHILLTKADKLKRGAAQNTLFDVQKRLKPYANPISIQTFSALEPMGVDPLKHKLCEWLLD